MLCKSELGFNLFYIVILICELLISSMLKMVSLRTKNCSYEEHIEDLEKENNDLKVQVSCLYAKLHWLISPVLLSFHTLPTDK